MKRVILLMFFFIGYSSIANDNALHYMDELLKKKNVDIFEYIYMNPEKFPVIHSDEYYKKSELLNENAKEKIIFGENLIKYLLYIRKNNKGKYIENIKYMIQAGKVIKQKRGYRNLVVLTVLHQIIIGSLIETLILESNKNIEIKELKNIEEELKILNITPRYFFNILKTDYRDANNSNIEAINSFADVYNIFNNTTNLTLFGIYNKIFEKGNIGNLFADYNNIDLDSFLPLIISIKIDHNFFNGIYEMKMANNDLPMNLLEFKNIANKANTYIKNAIKYPVTGRPYRAIDFFIRYRNIQKFKKYNIFKIDE